jgi:hypothetical protein
MKFRPFCVTYNPNRHPVTDSYIITTMPRTTCLVLSLLAIACPAAFAQEARATVGGRVTDPQGATTPNLLFRITRDRQFECKET